MWHGVVLPIRNGLERWSPNDELLRARRRWRVQSGHGQPHLPRAQLVTLTGTYCAVGAGHVQLDVHWRHGRVAPPTAIANLPVTANSFGPSSSSYFLA